LYAFPNQSLLPFDTHQQSATNTAAIKLATVMNDVKRDVPKRINGKTNALNACHVRLAWPQQVTLHKCGMLIQDRAKAN